MTDNSIKVLSALVLCMLFCFLAGCQDPTPVCPMVTGTPDYLTVSPELLPTPTSGSGLRQVQIGRSQMQVDKVVEGALCNDSWSGIVYVACNVQVYPWVEDPTFLKNCQLDIDPQAVVYVAYHNNTAYYKGCSCHTGETPEP